VGIKKYKDAVTVAPNIHKVIFENDRIRMLKARISPGQKANMHWHPENTSYILTAGRLRFTKPDKSTTEVSVTSEQVISSKEGPHAVENIGDSTIEVIQVEMK